jgi:hypothetical protein
MSCDDQVGENYRMRIIAHYIFAIIALSIYGGQV